MSGRGSESHLEVREGLKVPSGGPGGVGGPPERPRGVGLPTRWSEWGREAHLEVREESGDPPEGPGRVGRPTRWSGWGREAHLEVREGSGGPP